MAELDAVTCQKCLNFKTKRNCKIQDRMGCNGLGNRCSIRLAKGLSLSPEADEPTIYCFRNRVTMVFTPCGPTTSRHNRPAKHSTSITREGAIMRLLDCLLTQSRSLNTRGLWVGVAGAPVLGLQTSFGCVRGQDRGIAANNISASASGAQPCARRWRKSPKSHVGEQVAYPFYFPRHHESRSGSG